jgi:hypothetical protein
VSEHSSTDGMGPAASPFLNQELFADSSKEQFEPLAAALVAQSPFAGALAERRRSFNEKMNEPAEEWREQEIHPPAPHRAYPSGMPVDKDTAANVMWQIIRFLNHQDATDPDEFPNPPSWYRQYAPLLREWFLIVYGEKQGSTRKLPQGLMLRDRVDGAFAKTRPFIDVLRASGEKKWVENLQKLFYPQIGEFDYKAAITGPETPRPHAPVFVDFPMHPPKPVSLAEFLSATTRPSKAQEISRGYGRFSLGDFKPGAVFNLGGKLGQRVLLWSNGWEQVFFSRDGQIYAQDGRGFSEDVIFGSFAKAGEDAAGGLMLAQLMVDIGLSFTPWGELWDGVSALRDITAGDWQSAAKSLLPGAALKLAISARAVRKAAQRLPIAADVSNQIVNLKPGDSCFVGRGGYQLQVPGGGLEWRRGKWLVEETGRAGGPQKFQFFDDVEQRWREINDASKYITCSRCVYNALGKRGALIGEVDEILTEIASAPNVYAPARGRPPLIARKPIEEVIKAYGPEGGDVVDNILDAWRSAPDAIRHAEDTLIIAKDLSRIEGAADIFADLVTSSSTATGTLFELEWAAKHVDDIAAMGIPTYQKGWKGVGKGLDFLKKDRTAVELKNYDFTRWIYSEDPGRVAAGIRRQAISRLEWKKEKVAGVTFVFNSRAGAMPAALTSELKAALADLPRKYRLPVKFEVWPR